MEIEHAAASGSAGNRRLSRQLANVVVTPPLKLWHTYRTLEMVYRDAYFNQLNDRYAEQARPISHAWRRWAYEKLIETGIGIVTDPVPQAGTPCDASRRAALADGTYYVTVAWMNAAGRRERSRTYGTHSRSRSRHLLA